MEEDLLGYVPNPYYGTWGERVECCVFAEKMVLMFRNIIFGFLGWLVIVPKNIYNFTQTARTLRNDLSLTNELEELNEIIAETYAIELENELRVKEYFKPISLKEYHENITDPLYIVNELVDLLYLSNYATTAILALFMFHFYEHYREFSQNSKTGILFTNCLVLLGNHLLAEFVAFFFPRGYCYNYLSYILVKTYTFGSLM